MSGVYLEQFKIEAYTGKETLEKEAIEWLVTLNPFKHDNYLNPLIEFIRSHKNIPDPVVKNSSQALSSVDPFLWVAADIDRLLVNETGLKCVLCPNVK